METMTSTVASLLATNLAHDEGLEEFFLRGVAGLPPTLLAAIPAAQLDYVTQQVGDCPVEEFIHLWGDEGMALNALMHLNADDVDGLDRLIRVICYGWPDLAATARQTGRLDTAPVFHLGDLENGLPCLRMYVEGNETVVVTSEAPRLRNCVILQEEFRKAMELPSIVSAYAGQYMTVLGPLQVYPTAGVKPEREALGRLFNTLGLRKFTPAPLVEATGRTTWLKWFTLPNLALYTRLDHVAAELATGRLIRTLIDARLDNILIVANVLSRSQRMRNDSRLVPEHLLAPALSGYDRVRRLFPRLSGEEEMPMTGDLLNIAGTAVQAIKNQRHAHGMSATTVNDPRLCPGQMRLPEVMQDHVAGNNTVVSYKAPDFGVREFTVLGYSPDNVLWVNEADATASNEDHDGDQRVIMGKLIDCLELQSHVAARCVVNHHERAESVPGMPWVQEAKHTEDYTSLVNGKGLIGAICAAWGPGFQAVAALNPFPVGMTREAFVKFRTEITALLQEYQRNDYLLNGLASFRKFEQELPTGKDCAANRDGAAKKEMAMPKVRFSAGAKAMLAKLGITAEEARTLDGQRKIMDGVRVDPIGTLRIMLELEPKMYTRWLPRLIIAYLAMYEVCRSMRMTLTELMNRAPVGRKLTRGMGRAVNEKADLRHLLSLVTTGYQALISDRRVQEARKPYQPKRRPNQPMKPLEGSMSQRDLLAAIDRGTPTTSKYGLTSISSFPAVKLFVTYYRAVEGKDLRIIAGTDALDQEVYHLLDPATDEVVAANILMKVTAKPEQEFAELAFLDTLCTECGALVGYCVHTKCQHCHSIMGTCHHDRGNTPDYTVVTGQLDPAAAIAWQFTRPNLKATDLKYHVDVDLVLESFRHELTRKVGGDACSAGEVFNKFVRAFSRRIAYTPGLNVTRARGWAQTQGINLDLVATEWPLCPEDAAQWPHPAYAQCATDVRYGLMLAAEMGFIPEATSQSRPGHWMRHTGPAGHGSAYLELFDVAYQYLATSRAQIPDERCVVGDYGFAPLPVAKEGVPVDVLPQGLEAWLGYTDHLWNDGDQYALYPEYLRSVTVLRKKSIHIRKGWHILLTEAAMEQGFDMGTGKVAHRVLAEDPSGLFPPTVFHELNTYRPTWTAYYSAPYSVEGDHLVAEEDGVLLLVQEMTGRTGLKGHNKGNKGILVGMPGDVKHWKVMVGNMEIALDGFQSPSRFTAEKMKTGNVPIWAILTQVRQLRIAAGEMLADEVLRIPTEVTQAQLLHFALDWLYWELQAQQDVPTDEGLVRKLAMVTAHLAQATTEQERCTAMWPLAFHPVMEEQADGTWTPVTRHYAVEGECYEVPVEILVGLETIMVQPLFVEVNSTAPLAATDTRLTTVDREGCSSLRIAPNTSKAGVSFNQDYCAMSANWSTALQSLLYGDDTILAISRGKVLMLETFASCATQQPVTAFPEHGPIAYPKQVLFPKPTNTLAEDDGTSSELDDTEDIDVTTAE